MKTHIVAKVSEEWIELNQKWQSEIYHAPAASMDTSIELYHKSREFCLLSEGCSLISLGSSSFTTGDLHSAEGCFVQARPLVAHHSILTAEINRKTAAIRNREGATHEAYRLLNLARSQAAESGAEYGQILLQYGFTHQCEDDYCRAAMYYIDSFSYFDKGDILYVIAVNNTASALVRLRDHEAARAIGEKIQEIRRGVSPRSAIRARLDWLSLISSIRAEDYSRAVAGLPKISLS